MKLAFATCLALIGSLLGASASAQSLEGDVVDVNRNNREIPITLATRSMSGYTLEPMPTIDPRPEPTNNLYAIYVDENGSQFPKSAAKASDVNFTPISTIIQTPATVEAQTEPTTLGTKKIYVDEEGRVIPPSWAGASDVDFKPVSTFVARLSTFTPQSITPEPVTTEATATTEAPTEVTDEDARRAERARKADEEEKARDEEFRKAREQEEQRKQRESGSPSGPQTQPGPAQGTDCRADPPNSERAIFQEQWLAYLERLEEVRRIAAQVAIESPSEDHDQEYIDAYSEEFTERWDFVEWALSPPHPLDKGGYIPRLLDWRGTATRQGWLDFITQNESNLRSIDYQSLENPHHRRQKSSNYDEQNVGWYVEVDKSVESMRNDFHQWERDNWDLWCGGHDYRFVDQTSGDHSK